MNWMTASCIAASEALWTVWLMSIASTTDTLPPPDDGGREKVGDATVAPSTRTVKSPAVCADQGAAAVAPKWNIPTVYTNFEYDQLVALPDVDVVHITTPNKYHHAHCVAAFKAGKHVVCEKPLGMTSKETGELVKLAEKDPERIFAR